MDNHEVGEESMHRAHDGSRNHFALSIVAVEMQACEDAHQDRLEEASISVKRSPNLFVDRRTDLESLLLLPDRWLQQVSNDFLDSLKVLGGELWELADDSQQEESFCRNEVFHLLAPVSCAWFEDRVGEHLVVHLKRCRTGYKGRVDLECIPQQVSHVLLHDHVKHRRELILNRAKRFRRMLNVS